PSAVFGASHGTGDMIVGAGSGEVAEEGAEVVGEGSGGHGQGVAEGVQDRGGDGHAEAATPTGARAGTRRDFGELHAGGSGAYPGGQFALPDAAGHPRVVAHLLQQGLLPGEAFGLGEPPRGRWGRGVGEASAVRGAQDGAHPGRDRGGHRAASVRTGPNSAHTTVPRWAQPGKATTGRVPHAAARALMSSRPRPVSASAHSSAVRSTGMRGAVSGAPSSTTASRSRSGAGRVRARTTRPPARPERVWATALAKASPAHSSTASTRSAPRPGRAARSARTSARTRAACARSPG